MSKKEEFKTFVSSHPDLVSVVSSKKHTWQELFEVFDLYGSDENAWRKYLDNSNLNSNNTASNASSIGELTKLFKNINIESVQKYIDTAQKAIGIVQELSGGAVGAAAASSSGPEVARPINKIFED